MLQNMSTLLKLVQTKLSTLLYREKQYIYPFESRENQKYIKTFDSCQIQTYAYYFDSREKQKKNVYQFDSCKNEHISKQTKNKQKKTTI